MPIWYFQTLNNPMFLSCYYHKYGTDIDMLILNPIVFWLFFRLFKAADDLNCLTALETQERLLLRTYSMSLPNITSMDTVPGERDTVATEILKMCRPQLLHDHVPLAVSDRNIEDVQTSAAT